MLTFCISFPSRCLASGLLWGFAWTHGMRESRGLAVDAPDPQLPAPGAPRVITNLMPLCKPFPASSPHPTSAQFGGFLG